MPKKGTPLACKGVFQCSEAVLKREYTKKWMAYINQFEQRNKLFLKSLD